MEMLVEEKNGISGNMCPYSRSEEEEGNSGSARVTIRSGFSIPASPMVTRAVLS